MMDPDFKKKIANTISRYELKCGSMQATVDTLKEVIEQLVFIPGSNSEYSDYYVPLRMQLDSEFDPLLITKKVHRLSKLLAKVQKKKNDNSQAAIALLEQSLSSLSKIAHRPSHIRALSKLHHMLGSETEQHVFLAQFNEILSQSISLILNELNELRTADPKLANQPMIMDLSSRVNDSLKQLLNHLFIPPALDEKKEYIKNCLDQTINGDDLSKVIDGLTKLVVDAFNIEQNRFKGFLHELTNQLQDFDNFLKASSAASRQNTVASCLLEDGIQNDIQQIQNHLDTSKTIEELASKINQNLETIGSRIKEYRAHKEASEAEYQLEIKRLHNTLAESEHNAREINELITLQKYRINHDGLTGLPNRESYEERLFDAIQLWKRTGVSVALAVGDIDHFKCINDTFGHLAGDKVLKKVALILKSVLGENDFIARIGGEEFVFLFNGTTRDAVFLILEQVRQLVEECQFFYHEHKVDVTISFGLSTIMSGDDAESLFIRADNAMYKAKNSGRNRTEII